LVALYVLTVKELVAVTVPELPFKVPDPLMELADRAKPPTARIPGFVTVTAPAVSVPELIVLVPLVTFKVAKVKPLTLPAPLNVTVPPFALNVVGVKLPPTVVVPLVAS
jgi:hypothetical protein